MKDYTNFIFNSQGAEMRATFIQAQVLSLRATGMQMYPIDGSYMI